MFWDATLMLIDPENPVPVTPCQNLVVVKLPPQLASSHMPVSQTQYLMWQG